MVLDEEEKKKEAGPANSMDRWTGKIGEQEEGESRIELLQWYLKMILDSEEGPKVKQ